MTHLTARAQSQSLLPPNHRASHATHKSVHYTFSYKTYTSWSVIPFPSTLQSNQLSTNSPLSSSVIPTRNSTTIRNFYSSERNMLWPLNITESIVILIPQLSWHIIYRTTLNSIMSLTSWLASIPSRSMSTYLTSTAFLNVVTLCTSGHHYPVWLNNFTKQISPMLRFPQQISIAENHTLSLFMKSSVFLSIWWRDRWG